MAEAHSLAHFVNKTVVLKAHQGKGGYLTAEGEKIKVSEEATEHSHWVVEAFEQGKHVAFRSYNGHYLSVNDHKQVHLSHSRGQDSHLEPIKFEDDVLGTGPVFWAFKDRRNDWVSVDDHSHLKSEHKHEATKHERFQLEDVHNTHKKSHDHKEHHHVDIHAHDKKH